MNIGYFENRIPFEPVLGAYSASQTTLLKMEILYKTESPIFEF